MSEHTIEIAGVDTTIERLSDSSNQYVLEASVWVDGERYDVKQVFSLHTGGPGEDAFSPTQRSDWTLETMVDAIEWAFERNSRFDSEGIEAITDLEIEEQRGFVWQPHDDSQRQLKDIGVMPEDVGEA